jgi:hypothetical protein
MQRPLARSLSRRPAAVCPSLPRAALFSFTKQLMPANRLGPSRAIVQRSYRRGYAHAVGDIIAAINGHVPQAVLGRFYRWQKQIARWHKRANLAAGEADEFEPAPLPRFHGRDTAAH